MNRRTFLKTSAIGATSLTFPAIVRAANAVTPSRQTDFIVFLRQNRPERLDPFRESPLQINPPTFRWPTVARATSYRLEFSRDRFFSNARRELASDLFFRPLEPLEPGLWYWRCREESPDPGGWIGPESFEISADLPRWPVRDWAELVRRIPATHPRLYVRQSTMAEWRANVQRLAGELAPWQSRVRAALERKFSLETYTARVPAGGGIRKKKMAIWAARAAGHDAAHPLGDGAWMALATRDEWFIEGAKRRAMMVAALDPEGFTADKHSDFGNGAIVENLALAYDLLYDAFTEAERRMIRKAMVARARPIFGRMVHASQDLMRGHNWQHVFLNGMTAAIAMLGEEPVAAEWVMLGLKSFVSMYPWFGGNAGSSQEETHYYYETEMLSSLDTLDLFRVAFGLKLENGNPWFRANPYFLIYSYPPNSTMSKLGDSVQGERSVDIPRGKEELAFHYMAELDEGSVDIPRGKARLALQYMAERYGNGHAAAYAAALPKDHVGINFSQFLRWTKPVRTAPVSLATLPAARLFADIGAVFTHSDYLHPDQNVRLVFHSDPYGALNHAHADQNSFHLIAYNEDLLLDSGYRTPNGDLYRKEWYVQSKAHNTILVDGQGQSWGDTRGYGTITRFEENDGWVAMTGSAAHAYPKVPLDRFDRHIVWLRGTEVQTYVVVDDLATTGTKPRRFDWLLHAANRMTVDAHAHRIDVAGEKGEARVTLLEPAALTFAQDNSFGGLVAINWLQDKDHPLPNQWHLKVTPPPTTGTLFVSVIQVSKPGVTKPVLRAIAGGVETAGWRVRFAPETRRLMVWRAS